MKVEIDIPIALVGFIQSLEVDEIDGDKINGDIDASEHYYQLMNYGLVTGTLNDDEESEYFLTHLGKIVWEAGN
jgi:hypothetical protein